MNPSVSSVTSCSKSDQRARKGRPFACFCVLLAAALTLFLFTKPARAADYKMISAAFPSGLISLTNGSARASNGVAYAFTQGVPLTFVTAFAVGGVGTSNVIVGLDFTPDYTNWTSTTPVTITNSAVASISVTNGVVLPASLFTGYRAFRIGYVATTQTNLITFTNNLIVSWFE